MAEKMRTMPGGAHQSGGAHQGGSEQRRGSGRGAERVDGEGRRAPHNIVAGTQASGGAAERSRDRGRGTAGRDKS